MNLDSLSALIPLLFLQEGRELFSFCVHVAVVVWVGYWGDGSVFDDRPPTFNSEHFRAGPPTDA